MRSSALVLIAALLTGTAAQAVEPAADVTFGPELTLTRDDVYETFPSGRLTIKTEASVKAIEELVAHIKAKYKKETGLELTHKAILRRRSVVFRTHHRLIFPSGFYIELLPDPGVIEIIAQPGTVAQFKERRDLVQKYLYEAGAELGLQAFDYAGGGHIHIGNVFKNDPMLLRNFLVDYFNHPSLTDGALGNDPYNALSLSQMTEDRKASFQAVLEDFDSGRIRTSDELARAVIARVYKGRELDEYWASKDREWFNKARPARTHALNLKQLLVGLTGSGIGTVEVRALFPQKNFDQFINLIDLFARRITLLRALKEPLKYEGKYQSASPEAALKELSEYVRETGMNPAVFNDAIHPEWRREGRRVPLRCEEIFR